MGVLVIDIGTSGVRAAIVDGGAAVHHEHYCETLPDTPADGIVEFDARAYVDAAIDCARRALAEADSAGRDVVSIGISNQRGSAIVWDATTGEPVAAAQGWQDLRTIGECMMLAAEGFRFAPNQAATKFVGIWGSVDPDHTRSLRCGTPETWLIWCLTEGASFVTDPSNASITGLATLDADAWDQRILDRLGLPVESLPHIADSSGPLGIATVFDRPIPIHGVAGDQQASLVGQGCVRPGTAKVTFGTGGMLNLCVGRDRPTPEMRSAAGTFPLVAWRRGDEQMWAIEALMLSAGTNVQWLRDDLGIIDTAASSAAVAAACDHTDGVYYVPAQLGLGTPYWDYGARGVLVGLTRGSGRPEVVRAVLEGVAHRGADLLDAAERDSGLHIDTLRLDGGMSENPVFCQAVANATGRRVEVAPVKDATALGAAFLAGLESGIWSGWEEIEALWSPSRIVEPTAVLDRVAWGRAVERSLAWIPDLSAIDF